MSICTKTGDKGTTSLFTGERVAKNSLRVQAYGTVDEVSSALGLARAFAQKDEVKQLLLELEQTNLKLMADLASITDKYYINNEIISNIDQKIVEVEAKLPALTAFIMPGNTQSGAFLDLARTTTRRAEREVLTLAEKEAINENVKIYLNRLSDLCFLLMRVEEEL